MNKRKRSVDVEIQTDNGHAIDAEKIGKSITYGGGVNRDHVESVVSLFHMVMRENDSRQRRKPTTKLFVEDESVALAITAIKLPQKKTQQLIKIQLPHRPHPPASSACLIVKDLQRGLRIDHQQTLTRYTTLLEEKGCRHLISQIISFRELKTEYKEFEAKRALCQKFDRVLVDECIVRLVPMFLGKPFYVRKKFPVPVNLKKIDLQTELMSALTATHLPLNHRGTCSQITIGHSQMSSEWLADNICATLDVLRRRFPGGWPNIRALYLRTHKSQSVPLHLSDVDPNSIDVAAVKVDVERQIAVPVTDELSTLPGSVVRVDAYGNIRVKQVSALPEEDSDLLDSSVLANLKKTPRERKRQRPPKQSIELRGKSEGADAASVGISSEVDESKKQVTHDRAVETEVERQSGKLKTDAQARAVDDMPELSEDEDAIMSDTSSVGVEVIRDLDPDEDSGEDTDANN